MGSYLRVARTLGFYKRSKNLLYSRMLHQTVRNRLKIRVMFQNQSKSSFETRLIISRTDKSEKRRLHVSCRKKPAKNTQKISPIFYSTSSKPSLVVFSHITSSINSHDRAPDRSSVLDSKLHQRVFRQNASRFDDHELAI